jgi:hypothetical protein
MQLQTPDVMQTTLLDDSFLLISGFDMYAFAGFIHVVTCIFWTIWHNGNL